MTLNRGRSASDVLVLRERASATPSSATSGRSGPKSPSRGRSPSRPGLAASSLIELQEWFASGVMTPESQAQARGAERAEAILTAGPLLGALDRFEIYRRAYHARLIECLLDDYPILAHALGTEAFDALCRAYIESHPSTESNLNGFGRHMQSFCASEARDLDHRVFAADLAALEWAVVEVIHAEGREPLTMADLGAIAPDRWASAKLIPTPAFRLLLSSYPVNAYYQAVREDLAPVIPEASPAAVVVYRSGSTIWRMDLEDGAFRLLAALAAGQSLGGALDDAAFGLQDLSEEVAGRRVTAWFRDWVYSGLFSGVEAG